MNWIPLSSWRLRPRGNWRSGSPAEGSILSWVRYSVKGGPHQTCGLRISSSRVFHGGDMPVDSVGFQRYLRVRFERADCHMRDPVTASLPVVSTYHRDCLGCQACQLFTQWTFRSEDYRKPPAATLTRQGVGHDLATSYGPDSIGGHPFVQRVGRRAHKL